MSEQQQIGQHTVGFEAPLFTIRAGGDLTPADVRGIARFMNERAAGLPYVMMLGDVRRLGAIPPETRKETLKVGGKLSYGGIATFGATFQVRILTKLILGAAKLLIGRGSVPIRYFDTEAEARAWLLEGMREIAEAQPIAAE
jgi:hypothetical protein